MRGLIQWPSAKYWDKAWNPIIGCKPCSPACDNCYAKAMAGRFGMSFAPHGGKSVNPPRRGVVFCGNMTDLFGDWLGDGEDYICRSLGYYGKATYLWLTKRPHAMCEALLYGRVILRDDPDDVVHFRDCEFGNQWFGITAENQEWYDQRVDVWRREKPDWANGWLSAEPLLGPIDLRLGDIASGDLPFAWVVVGCESGPNRRPCNVEWVEGVVSQCLARGVPVFVKQLDLGGRCTTDIGKFPKDLRIRQVPWETAGGAE